MSNNRRLLKLLCSVIVFASFLATARNAYAASATIDASPDSASVTLGQTIDVKIDVNSDVPFNAVQSTITISPNMSIYNVTPGNCGLTFVKAPTVTNASFTGVILGGKSSSCTVATLTLRGDQLGSGTLTLQDNGVKSYDGANEIYTSSKNGRYTMNIQSGGGSNSNPSSSSTPTVTPSDSSNYNVTVSTKVPSGTPTTDLQVVLDAGTPREQTASGSSITVSGNTATATFSNVPEGPHAVKVKKGNETLSNDVLNVAGESKNVAVSIGKKTTPTWMLVAGAILVIAGLGIGGFFGYKYIKRKYSNT